MNDNLAMPARLSAFVIWAFVAAGLVFWGYRLWVRPMTAPANVKTVSESPVVRGDVSRMLGVSQVVANAVPAPVAASSRFRLLGVLAPPPGGVVQPSTRGVALIVVDGKPARPYKVGARLDGDLVLQSVSRRSASIGPAQGPASVVLELPPPLAPATGTLPKAVADGGAAPVTAPVPLPLPQPTPPYPQGPAQPQMQPPTPMQMQPQPQMQPQVQPQAQAEVQNSDPQPDESAPVSMGRRRSPGSAAVR